MTTNNNFKKDFSSLLGYSKPEAVQTDRFIDEFWIWEDLALTKSTYLRQIQTKTHTLQFTHHCNRRY